MSQIKNAIRSLAHDDAPQRMYRATANRSDHPAYGEFEFMPQISSVERFKVPLGGQEIELQHFVHDGGGMPLLRVRIRERRRFTVFEIDPQTAAAWGSAMLRWSEAQAAGGDEAA